MSSRIDLLFKKHFPYYGNLSKELTKDIKDFGMKIVEEVFNDLKVKKK